ncbi:hypothetical protein [Melittangium boletus]|uniref:Uncharacterized protein n=1 Tax=Melittangium boletus DSM 14713 TaxID=1294270 RepID=A0A250I6G3_9BACT|nr:hypothetical protein [Melittangium boletus]ATB26751.1 hypothetical protein MEBOL_000185 [Melittangium boletus DSM 14713]
MSWLWRMVLVAVVTLVPGAFLLLVSYLATRTMWEHWRLAQQESLTSGVPVSFREVLATVHVKDLVQQARAAL